MIHINAWTTYGKKDVEKVMTFGEEYKQFISDYKTAREFSTGAVKLAEEKGFKRLENLVEKGTKLKAGDKVYSQIQDRYTIMAVIGKKSMEKHGLNILGAHVDSPRIDIKQNPLYQSDGVCMFETHYYGGISLYLWVDVPMSLHGIVCKKDGTSVTINIGEKPDEPVFFINDLLIHLNHKDQDKPVKDFIDPEKMDLLVGSRPLVKDDVKSMRKYKGIFEEKELVEKCSSASEPGNKSITQNILKILFDKYGIQELDLESAELEAVPIGPARDCGFDSSMVMGYGHDDSACAYPSLRALLEMKKPEKTCMCVLVDKEEVGSLGATSMECRFFENTIAEVMELCGESGMLKLRRAMSASSMISSDVSAAVDPNFHEKFEMMNSCFMGDGFVLNKYGGSNGKKMSNDARPEFMAKLRKICNDNNVIYQTSELGKVGAGGGGTIAAIPANYGMDVIDAGVAVLSMHGPWEVVSKADIYEAFKGYVSFLKDC